MLKKEVIEKMKKDKELQELRKKVYSITGNLSDISFCIGKHTLEEWKEQLKEIIKKYESANQ